LNTLAPGTERSGEELKQDIGNVFSGDASLGDRAASLGKAMVDPYRMAAGAALEQGAKAYDVVGSGLNKTLGSGSLSDRAQGVGTLAGAPLDLAALSAQQGANLANSIPVVGGLTAAPLAAASQVASSLKPPTSLNELKSQPLNIANAGLNAATSVVPPAVKQALETLATAPDFVQKTLDKTKLASGMPLGLGNRATTTFNPAKQAAQAVLRGSGLSLDTLKGFLPSLNLSSLGGALNSLKSTLGGIFCYAGGTPIKMKDGSYKDVDKLKIGDELYYGGRVNAVGQSETKELYEYKGTKVTGGHAVFENGKFIRVADSIHGKKLNKTEKVYPIACEKHIMVTKTHLGSDFSEVEGGTNLTEEQRLEKLNSDKARLKKLDTASALLFKNKK
jgi:hypothetical protein